MRIKEALILACFLLLNIESIYSKEIFLSKNNSIVLRGEINSQSVSRIIREMMNKCYQVNDSNDRPMTDEMTDENGLSSGNHRVNDRVTDKMLIAPYFLFPSGKVNRAGVKNDLSSVTNNGFIDQVVEFVHDTLKVKSHPTLYLVLDSPGGSVMDGLDLIRVMSNLPCKVETVSIEAISMAFQIVQASSYRYMATLGTQMSHRAALGGIGGQLDGELESRLAYIKAIINSLDVKASQRIGISLEDYKAKIVNEWWLFGEQAIEQGTADEMAEIHCSDDLIADQYVELSFSFFGMSKKTYSSCPLLRNPVD